MTDERPAGSPPDEPAEKTPSWPARAAKVAANAAWNDLSDTGRRLVDTGRWRVRGAWSRRPSRAGQAAWAFVVAAGIAGAASLLAQTRLPGALPTELDWRAAAALLDRDARPGDAVVVSPPWAERARSELPVRLPVYSLSRYRGEPLLGVRRVWLLSLADAPHARGPIARDVAERAFANGGTQRLGALAVTRYDLAQPARAIAFLPDWLEQARARVGEKDCARDGPLAFLCPGEPPFRVVREVREVGGAPRPCIAASPGSAESGPLTLTFPSVPVGLKLRGGAGVVGRLPSAPDAPPIRFAVQIDGEEVAASELPSGAPTFTTFDVGTGALAAEPHAVTIVISSPAPAGRTVCFDAWTQP